MSLQPPCLAVPAKDPADCIRRALACMTADTAEANRLAAVAMATTDPDSSLGGQARHMYGISECMLGRIASGQAHLLEATGVLQRHGPPLAECRVWRDYASVMTILSGDVQAGVAAFERALALADTLGDPIEQGAVLAKMGPAMGRAGRKADAKRVMERAVELLLQHAPGSTDLASAYDKLGYELILDQDYARAVPLLRAELALRDPVRDRVRTANCHANLAVALAGIGQGDEARALISGIASCLNPETEPYQWGDYLMQAGSVNLLLGEAHVARSFLHQSLAVARQHAMHSIEIDVLVQLTTAEERCGDPAAALACARELRAAERKWLDDQTASRVKVMEAHIELAEEKAENQALAKVRAELEQRVEERTAALQGLIRERESAQELARFWADHDWLTRLPNRRHLQTLLTDSLVKAQAEGTLLGLLFVDLDGFKAVNDGHGHLAGDRLLRLTARRLRRCAPAGAIVTRFGGDEFVVLLPRLADAADATSAAQRLRAAVQSPTKLDGRLLRMSCSVGVAVGPRDAVLPDELLRCADRAMLEAKLGGRNQVRQLDADGQHRLERRGRLRRELGHAIEHGLLSADYQPLWDVRRQCLAGVELLARWHDAELGWVSPADFIPVAEESGQIQALGDWAVREAVRAALILRATDRWTDSERISVNVSMVQLGDPHLVERLIEAVTEAGGQPQWLELELTESVQMAEDPTYQKRMLRLRDAGFHLAIDDFGSGYSSFSYLNRAYFDRLKIDRALVQAAVGANDGSAVTGSIILMAHRLGLQVVAEGVETVEQIELLAAQDCDVVQGYHIARPMSLDRLLVWDGHGGNGNR